MCAAKRTKFGPGSVLAVAVLVSVTTASGTADSWVTLTPAGAVDVEEETAATPPQLTVLAADEQGLQLTLETFGLSVDRRKTKGGDESSFARRRLVNAARAAGVQAIDSVYGDVGDMDGLKSWAMSARAMGFEGMGCIHPRQIRPIHEAFAPSGAEIEKALKIVAAFDEAKARGLGVVSLGTRMIDPPVVLRAQRLVDLARKSGLIPDTPEK